MKKTARAVVLNKPNGQFSVREYAVPAPQSCTVLIKQEMSGICGSDAHIYQGHLPGLTYPIILGHEIAGRIDRLGEGISCDILGKPVSEGDRVILIPNIMCGKCYYCKILKEPTNCLSEVDYGITMGPADKEPYFNGGFADYIYAASPKAEFLKTNLPAKIAVLLEPFTMGLRCAEKAKVNPEETVVIQGSGAVGLFTLIAAKERGASKTIIIGGPKERLELAKEFGADVAIDISDIHDPKERVKMVKEQTFREFGADVVVECTGIPAAVPEGMDMLRPFGRFVEVGHFTDNGTCEINPYLHLVRKQITVVPVYGSETGHFVKGLPILESRKYPFERIVSHTLPLERVMDGIKAIMTGYKLDGRDVIKIAVSSES